MNGWGDEMSELTKKLISEFSDYDYAHAYMEAHAVSRIAAQVHAIRKQRGWSQSELAEKSGMAQERVSKIESADFESVTLKTLNKFAEAFDVHLHVSFVPFSQGIVDVANITSKGLEVEPRKTDLALLNDRRNLIIRSGEAWQVVQNHLRVVTPMMAKVPAVGAKLDDEHHLNTDWQPIGRAA